jgi:hypothetical protein
MFVFAALHFAIIGLMNAAVVFDAIAVFTAGLTMCRMKGWPKAGFVITGVMGISSGTLGNVV